MPAMTYHISRLTELTHEILSISGNVDIETETGIGVGRLPENPASCVGCVSVIAATLTLAGDILHKTPKLPGF